ncbi:MAG: efflux RND transporter periplasmic adaptor subunit [Muribaculaceae bacterium]|nr:efflux RND transporter periplasmic adaptor subunit [Muribaculaceae bacterium]
MKKFFKILLWILVGVIFIATFIYLYLNSQDKAEVYSLEYPKIETLERATVLTGKVEPRDEIDIKPQISGIISEILVEAGDHVNNGDIIAKIKVIPEEAQLSSAENRVAVAEISLNEARQTFERTRQLYEKKYESREKYETDMAAFERAKRELDQARDQLTIVRDGVSAANAQGSNTLVRSTVTGVVLEVPVKVGSSVIQANTFNDGTTIAKVADMTDLIFKGKVDETEVDLLKEGMSVKISVGAIAGSEFPAVIEKIAPMASDDNGTNTFEVKAALNAGDASNLRAGYSANANVILERADSVLAVPESVVEYEGDKAFVNILTDSVPVQKFERKEFVPGLSNGIYVEVKSGDLKKTTPLRGNIEKK